MTKQEEIREGIADFLWEIYKRRVWIYRHPDREEFLRVTATGELIDYLHSQGVVIKVANKPSPEYLEYKCEECGHIGLKEVSNNYVDVEPLIGEVK